VALGVTVCADHLRVISQELSCIEYNLLLLVCLKCGGTSWLCISSDSGVE
jgi:hypothetical protein